MTESDNAAPGGKPLTWWLLFAIFTVILGAVLLFPIGNNVMNVVFIIVKLGMLAGILMLLVKRDMKGFWVWAAFAALAIVMTIVKWQLNGTFEWIYALAIATDLAVPAIALVMLKRIKG
jgi:hypothetical protein